MSAVNLPKEWTTLIAAECFDQISTNGIKVKTKDCHTSGLHPVIDQGQEFISGYIDDSAKLIKIDNPVIIFGDHTRNIKWVDFDFVPGADGTKILTPKEFLLPRIAFYGLKNLEIPDKGYSRHFKFLKELAVPLPPLAEQKVIADKLDTLLAQVETTKARLDRIPQILKTFRQSVLAAAVSGKLTEEWRQVRKLSIPSEIISECDQNITAKKVKNLAEKPLLDEELIFSVPESWQWIRLSKITEIVSGVAKGSKNKGITVTRPYLRVANVQRGFLDLEEIKDIDVPEIKAKGLELKFGDILFNEGGDLDKLGRGWVWEDQIPNCIHQNHVFRARCLSKQLEPKFISFYGNSEGKEYFIKNGTQSVNLASINKTTLSLLPVPLPPAEEQTEIVRRVEQLFAHADKIEQQVQAAQQRVNKLTQSILAKAFRGELTAQWRIDNPDLISGENSAEALLTKINAEREAHAGKKKTAKKRKTKTV